MVRGAMREGLESRREEQHLWKQVSFKNFTNMICDSCSSTILLVFTYLSVKILSSIYRSLPIDPWKWGNRDMDENSEMSTYVTKILLEIFFIFMMI